MASRLNPYISFDGNARQAMEFYQNVFGGELNLMTFGQFPGGDESIADRIMHGQLETPAGYTLMCSDPAPGMAYDNGTRITVSLSGDDAAELRGYFQKLSASGTVTMALQKQMWGDEYGALTDQFGVNWMVNIAGSAA
jgi:PhnB protein